MSNDQPNPQRGFQAWVKNLPWAMVTKGLIVLAVIQFGLSLVARLLRALVRFTFRIAGAQPRAAYRPDGFEEEPLEVALRKPKSRYEAPWGDELKVLKARPYSPFKESPPEVRVRDPRP